MPTEPGLEKDRAPLHGPRKQIRDVTTHDVISGVLDGDVDAGWGVGGRGDDTDDGPMFVLLQYQLTASVTTHTVLSGIVRRNAQQIDLVDRNYTSTHARMLTYHRQLTDQLILLRQTTTECERTVKCVEYRLIVNVTPNINTCSKCNYIYTTQTIQA